MKLTQEQAESFCMFSNTSAGQHLLRYLGQVAEQENRAFIGARENVHRHQGRVQMVTQLLETLLDAGNAAEEYSRPKT